MRQSLRHELRARPLLVLSTVVLALVATPSVLPAQGPISAALQEVRRNTAAGDHARAVFLADSLLSRVPYHPSVVLARAVALARAGRRSDAVAAVRQLLRWDPRYARRALQDSALVPLHAEFRHAVLDSLVALVDRPIARGHVWAVLAERDLIPEGTAWDPATRSVLVGSLNKNKIVAIAPDGSVTDRVPAGSHGLGSVAGIHVDRTRGVLWVTSNARFDQAQDTTRSRLFAFDAATGAFRSAYAAPGPRGHFLNDLTTGPDGAVYVTDSRAGRVWVRRPGRTALEPFTAAGDVLAPNGITTSTDGRHLFVADVGHIQVVSLESGQRWRLAMPDSIHLAGGIDGLAFVGDALIAHHPLVFWRIVRYRLDPAYRAITGRELLEANTPDSRTSTTGEVAGDHYVFIGNGQIDRMNARTIDSATMDPVRMYRIRLDAPGGGLVAVALSAADSVALFDAQTLDRLATLLVGHDPHEIAPSPEGTRAYVANSHDTSITVIEVGAAPRVTATWHLPDSIRVHDVAVSADGGTVWAASGERQVVLELDASSGRIRRRFPTARAGGWMLETAGPGGAIVIAHLEGGAVALLTPGDGRQRAFEGRAGEIDAQTTPDGREIWAVNFLDGHLTVFDGATGRERSRQLSGPQAGRVVFTPDGWMALTVNSGDSTVVAWDVRTYRRLGSTQVAAGPKVIALSRDGRRAYITHPARGALTMLDVPSMTVLRLVPLAGGPDGVAVLEPRAP